MCFYQTSLFEGKISHHVPNTIANWLPVKVDVVHSRVTVLFL